MGLINVGKLYALMLQFVVIVAGWFLGAGALRGEKEEGKQDEE